MAKYGFGYRVYKEEDVVFESTAQVSLTKKNFQEMEQFTIDHGFSPEMPDIPAAIYDKCMEAAFEMAMREFPEVTNYEDGYEVDLEEMIPDSFLDQFSAETRQKVKENSPFYFE